MVPAAKSGYHAHLGAYNCFAAGVELTVGNTSYFLCFYTLNSIFTFVKDINSYVDIRVK